MITYVPRILLAGVMIGALSAPLAAQQDFSNVQIRTERLTEGLFVLMGAGGNIGLSIGEDGPFVVDDQFAPLTAKIKMAVNIDARTAPGIAGVTTRSAPGGKNDAVATSAMLASPQRRAARTPRNWAAAINIIAEK